jgi:tetratricopeptide (TPR) repeat protein
MLNGRVAGGSAPGSRWARVRPGVLSTPYLRALYLVVSMGQGALLSCAATPVAEAPRAAPEQEPAPEEHSGFAAGVDAITASDFEKARTIFAERVEKEPTNARAHFYLGVALQNLGQGSEAMVSYEKALSLDPKLSEAWINLAAARLDAGDAAGALDVVERGLHHHPKQPALLYNRALALSGTGKKSEALAAYRDAAAADPSNLEVKYSYAEALVNAGSRDAGVKLLEELAQSDKLEVLASTARLLGKLQKFDSCVQALSKAIGLKKSSELYVARGLCEHGRKDDAAAYLDFQRATQTDATYAPGYYYAGMQLKLQGKKAEARSALARAVEIAGDEGVGKAAKRALENL